MPRFNCGRSWLLAWAYWLCSHQAWAQQPLVVAFSYAKAPYIAAPSPYAGPFLDIDAPGLGLEIDLLKAALAHSGLRFKLYYGSFARIIDLLSRGVVDAAETSGPDVPGIYYSKPLIFCTNVAISYAVDQLKIDRIEDLQRYSVVAWQGATTDLGPAFHAVTKSNRRYYENPDQQAQYRMFASRRVQVLVIDKHIFRWWHRHLGTQPDDAYAVHAIFPQDNAYRIGFRSKAARDRFDAGLEAIKGSGEYARIMAKYLN